MRVGWMNLFAWRSVLNENTPLKRGARNIFESLDCDRKNVDRNFLHC
jgi:hypothetical protein